MMSIDNKFKRNFQEKLQNKKNKIQIKMTKLMKIREKQQ